ncbi:MAG: hypothetical protein HY717_24460 [Planctomycetes bacterium]|nr:hypothetical protein [Planctomycetota bacterium]
MEAGNQLGAVLTFRVLLIRIVPVQEFFQTVRHFFEVRILGCKPGCPLFHIGNIQLELMALEDAFDSSVSNLL